MIARANSPSVTEGLASNLEPGHCDDDRGTGLLINNQLD
jgi:hypothetical protein